MAVPWLADFPGPWEVSSDSGATWSAYNVAANIPQTGAATGVQRFRPASVTFNRPAGLTATTLRVVWGGDLHASTVNDPPQLRIDGVVVATAQPPLSTTVAYTSLIPMPSVGVHTFEVWVGSSGGLSGLTRLAAVQFEAISLMLVPPLG